ncbi:MAG: hypothetical protein ACKO8U_12985, partial [Pirellula sp.]
EGGLIKFLAVGCRSKTAVLSRFASRFSDASLAANVDDFSEIIDERQSLARIESATLWVLNLIGVCVRVCSFGKPQTEHRGGLD